MLPTFTTEQVNDGIDHTDLLIDLSDYMKKKDAATKDEIQILTDVLANKLDAKPQHKHDMADIELLQSTFDTKLDKERIKDINFITAPRVEKLTIRPDSSNDSYSFEIDNSTGDLVIILNDSVIGSYSKINQKWSFETDTSGVETKINTMENTLNNYIAKTDAVLKNHYDAILVLCQKHGMIDSNENDNENITPEND